MSLFSYRAVTASGELRAGSLEAGSAALGLVQLRQSGLSPIELVASTAAPAKATGRGSASRSVVATAVAELAVLLDAGLTLDRALGVCTENVARPSERLAFAALHRRVKEGARLSQAMAAGGGLFPPMAVAMAEAGEANGQLAEALAKLAETLERGEALRRTVVGAMIYPAMLLVIALSVILMMLLWVVPQFEGLFTDAGAALPPMTRAVLATSHAVRSYGLVGLLVLGLAGLLAWRWLRSPAARAGFDRRLLGVPTIGRLVRAAETARFARVLGSLVEGGVPLPDALAIARRSLNNSWLAAAAARLTVGVKQGGRLTALLAAEPAFPRVALSFVRTGEETARLGAMLERLADILERDLRSGLERMIAILTPLITVVMGAIVATVIASIMTAILGFNDLALSS